MRISDWSSDVCSSDLLGEIVVGELVAASCEPVGVERPMVDEVTAGDAAHHLGGDLAIPDVVGLDRDDGGVGAGELAAGLGDQHVVCATLETPQTARPCPRGRVRPDRVPA